MITGSRMTRPANSRILALAALCVVLFTVMVAITVFGLTQGRHADAAHAETPARPVSLTGPLPAYRPVPVARLAALPVADYAAVLPGLIPATSTTVGAPTQTATVHATAPLFGDGARTPVARVQPTDFTGSPTVISIVRTSGDWALVLTPARQVLPSLGEGHVAAAQTAAWIPKMFLQNVTPVTPRVVVSVSRQQVTVTQPGKPDQVFPVAVGTKTDPTPVGVTGYLEQRYVDPADGTGATRIQLTSLHSASVDNPVPGTTGGLIALHYYPHNTGAISHGCIRLTTQALAVIDTLPLGTPVVITN